VIGSTSEPDQLLSVTHPTPSKNNFIKILLFYLQIIQQKQKHNFLLERKVDRSEQERISLGPMASQNAAIMYHAQRVSASENTQFCD